MNDLPLVSVCVRSYCQERFIKSALDSVLAQQTSFPFEIIVSDDCSSDCTRSILLEYKRQFPQKIRLILGETNVGGPNNLRRVIEVSSAKYVTCLDGDDYYLCTDKLQKQVDFLESHSEYSACFHNTLNVTVDGVPLGNFNPANFHSVHDAREFICEKWFVPIHSAVIRRKYIEFPDWYDTVMNDDYVLHLMVARHGAYYYMPDVMVAYRHHDNEISVAYKDKILIDKQLKTILVRTKPMYPAEYAEDFDWRIAEFEREIKEETQLAHPIWKWFNHKTYTRAIRKWKEVVFHQ